MTPNAVFGKDTHLNTGHVRIGSGSGSIERTAHADFVRIKISAPQPFEFQWSPTRAIVTTYASAS
jgi:hypothetical protein